MLNKVTLKAKIVILILLMSGALVALGFLGFKQLKSIDDYTNHKINALEENVALLLDIEQAHVIFKIQVQEWKNILIRGNDEKKYEKYLNQFSEAEKKVQGYLNSAIDKSKKLGIKAIELKQLAADHAELGNKYLSALNEYDKSIITAGQKVDKLVSGVDRAASTGMATIALATERNFEKLVQETRLGLRDTVDNSISNYTKSAALFIAIVVIASLIIFYDIYRVIGGEPASAADLVRKVADGQLDTEIVLNTRFKNSLIGDIAAMKDRLVQVISEVSRSSDSLASASEQINSTSQSLSRGASNQAASVEETSASMEEMSASIEQNNENASITDQMAQQAASDAAKGGESVAQTVAAMKKIAERISVIDDIAYQTNLLALNAAIEAGRAGEHGRGFAVVASEVRKLAERSQVAAQDIGELASASVERAELAGKLLEQMLPSISKTADLVQEISAASSEQASGVQQIYAAIAQVSNTMQQNAAASEELSATAEEMSSQAQRLQDSIDFFRLPSVSKQNHFEADAPGKSSKRSEAKTAPKPKSVAADNSTDIDDDDKNFVKYAG